MKKPELIEAVAAKSGVAKGDVEATVNGLFEVLSECLAKGEKVSVPGYLSVERTLRSARKGRNPRTGEEMDIPASHSAKLTAGSKLKAAAKGAPVK